MPHYAVATMKKMKADNLSGTLRHNFRETENHKNKDIDSSKSDQNLELVADHKLRKQDVMDYIQGARKSSRKVRKDAVVLDEWIISSDSGFFSEMDSERTEGYFRTAVDYFGEKFGRKNIMYASVHLDETTPHMHMGIVPMTKDGKLSSKRVFDRNVLRVIQTEFPRYMQEHGYEVVRGSENSQRKKLTVDEYKDVQENVKAYKQLEHDMTAIADEIDPHRAPISPSEEVKQARSPESYGYWDEENEPQSKLPYVFEWFEDLAKEIKERWDKLLKRERKVDQRERELVQREVELAKQQVEVLKKERAIDDFLEEYQAPDPRAQPIFYAQQVNDKIVKPAQKLAKELARPSSRELQPVQPVQQITRQRGRGR